KLHTPVHCLGFFADHRNLTSTFFVTNIRCAPSQTTNRPSATIEIDLCVRGEVRPRCLQLCLSKSDWPNGLGNPTSRKPRDVGHPLSRGCLLRNGMTPDSLSQMLADFLDGARAAVVVEDGAITFDLAESKYSISGEYNKCLLHLWSSERNFVRRVLDAEVKATTLRLQVQRMGQNRPTRLDFCRDRDQRSPAARRAARVAYEPRLRRALERHFPEWTIIRLTTSIDLEHSFGPAYLRGWLRQGQRALAIVGVNDQETQSTVDGALTCGILWLEACRLAQHQRRVVEG